MPEATLNSKFYGLILPKVLNSTVDDGLILPQRIPRLGFFEELSRNEITEFSDKLNQIREELRKEFYSLNNCSKITRNEYRRLILLFDLLIRLGDENLLTYAKAGRINAFSDPQFVLKIENAKISYQVSLSLPVDLTGLVRLIESLRNQCQRHQMSPIIMAKSRLLVASARYGQFKEIAAARTQAAEFLKSVLPTVVPGNNMELLQLSMAWRALPMFDGFDAAFKAQCLANSLACIDRLDVSSKELKIIKDELLITTLLSVSKQKLASKDLDGFLATLTDAIAIDGFDSTIPSEIGLHLFREERWKDAMAYFEKAMKLGPPGLAMNTFFLAKCHRNLNNTAQAQMFFSLAWQYDETAVSPPLELFELFSESGNGEQAFEIKNKILSNPDLVDQLSLEEKAKLDGNS